MGGKTVNNNKLKLNSQPESSAKKNKKNPLRMESRNKTTGSEMNMQTSL